MHDIRHRCISVTANIDTLRGKLYGEWGFQRSLDHVFSRNAISQQASPVSAVSPGMTTAGTLPTGRGRTTCDAANHCTGILLECCGCRLLIGFGPQGGFITVSRRPGYGVSTYSKCFVGIAKSSQELLDTYLSSVVHGHRLLYSFC
jgi:hypothetical protein